MHHLSTHLLVDLWIVPTAELLLSVCLLVLVHK